MTLKREGYIGVNGLALALSKAGLFEDYHKFQKIQGERLSEIQSSNLNKALDESKKALEKSTSSFDFIFIPIGIFAIIYFVYWIFSPSDDKKEPDYSESSYSSSNYTPKSSTYSSGSSSSSIDSRREGKVRQSIFAAESEDVLDELIKYSAHGDSQGVYGIIAQGKAVALNVGTTYRIIEPGMFVHKIRITSGALSGQVLYIQSN